jgi:hypothetical protein
MKRGASALLVPLACAGVACTAILGTFDDNGTGTGGTGGTAPQTASGQSASSSTSPSSSTSASISSSTGASTTSSTSASTSSSSSGVCLGMCCDSIRDGMETDVDCGGPVCPKCADLKQCLVNADCFSLHCYMPPFGPLHCIPATCFDGMKDGTETDVDCGGECPPCATGKACMTDNDCLPVDCCINHKCT